jgi:guanylate kinase
MNQLTRLEDFQKVLANYTPSEEAKALLAKLPLVLFVGPTSSGRNTIIYELVKSGRYHFIVSDTTRQPRMHNGKLEENGGPYWFRAEADVLHDLEAGQFIEAAIIHNQQVSGMSMRELVAATDKGKIAVHEMEVAGAHTIHAVKPDGIFLFIISPSFNEWQARMQSRGSLPEEEVRRRMQSAVDEITVALERDYYHFVVNDTFIDTAQRIDDIISGKPQSDEVQIAARQTAEKLLADTRAYLATQD